MPAEVIDGKAVAGASQRVARARGSSISASVSSSGISPMNRLGRFQSRAPNRLRARA